MGEDDEAGSWRHRPREPRSPRHPDREEEPLQVSAPAVAAPGSSESTPGDLSSPGASLEELFREHWERIFHAAYRITGNAGDAEDAAQTVFLRIARHQHRVEPDTAAAYLTRAGVRAALDVVRSRKRSRSTPLEDVPRSLEQDRQPSPERGSLSRELARGLRRCLEGLPPRAAEIFALRYFEGHRNRDIATLLDMTPTAVAVTLHRVRGQLQEELAPLAGGTHP